MTCPRCRGTDAVALTTSPVPGVFTVFRCPDCIFVWRSTEPRTMTDPDHYPPRFRLTAADIAAAIEVPTIAPRR
ncbi:non-oxidative hydroxyarylic acid decarboxylases subunit D [Pseudonocardia sp. KRD291]|uniref:non-oxidative hydroxyarylic acid decarboxylases subunit D n=1 Tax=Pseudonocardia sp. KRD291 TaxID=2792007 RepID=UPI001C49FB72|nr:non-oxidative hydroxyarylic acid decarboxylases subunit D [Pseudonocardia sp. KRD291]MBW0103024.1 hypothetical protein [Pseudonocardia sp. KRD291]